MKIDLFEAVLFLKYYIVLIWHKGIPDEISTSISEVYGILKWKYICRNSLSCMNYYAGVCHSHKLTLLKLCGFLHLNCTILKIGHFHNSYIQRDEVQMLVIIKVIWFITAFSNGLKLVRMKRVISIYVSDFMQRTCSYEHVLKSPQS